MSREGWWLLWNLRSNVMQGGPLYPRTKYRNGEKSRIIAGVDLGRDMLPKSPKVLNAVVLMILNHMSSI